MTEISVKTVLTALIIVFSTCFCLEGFGQQSAADSMQYQALLRKTLKSYKEAAGLNAALYTGFDYLPYDPRIKGSAYLSDSLIFEPGTICYHGINYADLPLVYDTYRDIIVSNLNDPYLKYSLVSEYVDYFECNGRHFIRLNSDTTNIKTGFYEEVYTRGIRVLVKRETSIQDNGASEAGSHFESKVNYFVGKGRQYYRVTGEGDLLKVFKDKKNELETYIKARSFKFKRDPVAAMILLASYYDSLSN